jgi:hypothetical protein
MAKVKPYLVLLDGFACGIRCPQVNSRVSLLADQGDGDETRAAQGAFLKELGMASEMIQ